jgi:hypothetical protein
MLAICFRILGAKMEANCLKVVTITDNGYESTWGGTLGKYNRIYEIGVPVYPEEGTMLFCYELGTNLTEMHSLETKVFLAYAENLIEAKANNWLSFIPSDETIINFWQNPRNKKIPDYSGTMRKWMFASSITLLEPYNDGMGRKI